MSWQEFVDGVDDSHQMTTSRCHIRLLAQLAGEAETVLELGSHAGISTAAMALAAPKATSSPAAMAPATMGDMPRSLLKKSASRPQITAAPTRPSSPSMSLKLTPELLASLLGNRWPSIIRP